MALDGFEVFTQRWTPNEARPFITIQKRGTLGLNKSAVDAIGKPDAVELLFNPQKRVMAIRPAAPGAPHAYLLRKQGASDSYLISMLAFAAHWRIPLGQARRYEGTTEDGALLIELSQEAVELVPRAEKKRS